MAETTVERDDENDRYTLSVDGELAGFTEIHPDGDGRLRLPHTVIIPSYRGQGLAGALVAGALADISARGETVVPLCPVAQKYLRENDVDGLQVDWPDA
ncbi:GNAT family N-acetyltransferase [Microbacterium protaetiae]|uniref:GNAT family N-acetyltransferase n=1 Tax=Microbacterium protaetiae TaxID=2509458 RepID=A0A4P6EIA0_9MICO|nr:GNAT family N-acetyltransferase [Microbacterium protaetiae]QAY59887.1 GNAT family N-acetyltransferase [Microbacterium protaetiae]